MTLRISINYDRESTSQILILCLEKKTTTSVLVARRISIPGKASQGMRRQESRNPISRFDLYTLFGTRSCDSVQGRLS